MRETVASGFFYLSLIIFCVTVYGVVMPEKFKDKALPDEFPAGTQVHADLSAFADWLIAQPGPHGKPAAKNTSKPGASA